ncbi:MAG: alpha/beta hydrolase [Lachnospiraceae bacterium]|nr:alpha/beta hydrolase [Lachnospiraceae bacterium]
MYFPKIRYTGFSLGSFLLREYLGRYDDEMAGAAILGTGYQPGAILSVMIAIVRGQIKKVGFEKTTPLVKKLSFETYNHKFQPNRTPSDWLCADEAQIDAYLTDPLCRKDISAELSCSCCVQ